MLSTLRGKPLSWYIRTPLFAYRKVRHALRVRRGRRAALEVQEARRLWKQDVAFQALIGSLRQPGHEMYQDDETAYLLFFHARQVASLPGEVAELGVYRGGSAKLLASVFPDKPVHLFDTFQGMPETSRTHDQLEPGVFADTSLEAVRAYLADCPHVAFHPGFFPDTASPVEDHHFCFVHLDADIYSSTLSGIEFFYPRMNSGGVMAFHDYAQPDCRGVREAIDEFFADKPETVVFTPPNQCFVIKL
jgi:hypothetical protein